MSHLNRDRIRKAVFETLEDRRLLSTVTLINGTLTVRPDGAQPVKLFVEYDAARDQIRAATDARRTQVFDRADVRAIDVVGTDGNDTVYINGDVKVSATIVGGGGNDKLVGGAGKDVIDGGGGNDTILGRGGNDRLFGGEGNDFIQGGLGDDTVDGAAGNDRLYGTSGNDTITGGAGNDYLNGESENDILRGGEGNDQLLGGPGNDTLDGGGGANQIITGGGKDKTSGANLSGNTDGTSNGSSGGSVTPSGSSVTPTGGSFNIDPLAAAPTPVIQFIEASGMAGHTVHVNALSTKLGTGDPLNARYQWDFGDAASRYNTLVGWNAAHVYDKPGTYSVTLTVTDAAGKTSRTSGAVTISADTRRAVYVDVNGSDSNSGASPQNAVKTLARASELLGDNAKLLLHRGQTFNVADSIDLHYRNLTIDSYGEGADARVRKVEGAGTSIFYLGKDCDNILAQNIEFDSKWGLDSSYGADKVPARAFTVWGTDFTVRNCTFRNLTDGVNTEGQPRGVLIQDNLFTDEIRGGGIWGEGTDHVYLGNTMKDSRQEHLIRTSNAGVTRLLVANNDLSRPNNGKGSLELRAANWFYVTGNHINGGTLRVGMRELDLNPAWAAEGTNWGVVENNHTEKVFINIRPGTKHLAVRNNVVKVDGLDAILIETCKPGFTEKTDDIRLESNTAVNMGQAGSFLRVNGHATNVEVNNNLYVAPHLAATGGGSAGAVYVADADLSGFREIAHNVWPSTALTRNQGGLNYVWSSWGDTRGYRTPQQWESFSQVHDDAYQGVDPDVYQVTLTNGVTAGSSLKLAA